LAGPGQHRIDPGSEGVAGLSFVLRETGQPMLLGLQFTAARRQSCAPRANARRRAGPNRRRRRTMPTMTTSRRSSITRAAQPRRRSGSPRSTQNPFNRHFALATPCAHVPGCYAPHCCRLGATVSAILQSACGEVHQVKPTSQCRQRGRKFCFHRSFNDLFDQLNGDHDHPAGLPVNDDGDPARTDREQYAPIIRVTPGILTPSRASCE
jgi:hypothetical protein